MPRGYNNQTPFSSESGMSSTFFLFLFFLSLPLPFHFIYLFCCIHLFPPITNNILSHSSLSIDCIS